MCNQTLGVHIDVQYAIRCLESGAGFVGNLAIVGHGVFATRNGGGQRPECLAPGASDGWISMPSRRACPGAQDALFRGTGVGTAMVRFASAQAAASACISESSAGSCSSSCCLATSFWCPKMPDHVASGVKPGVKFSSKQPQGSANSGRCRTPKGVCGHGLHAFSPQVRATLGTPAAVAERGT